MKDIEPGISEAIETARRARARGFDPEPEPEARPATDMASRVENLAGPEGIAGKIRALKGTGREALALECARAILRGEFGLRNSREAAEQALRTALAVLTEGCVVAPTEGLTGVEIGRNRDGTRHLSLHFAGPIRSAGGTAAAMTVLIADSVRKELYLDRYKPTEREVGEFAEEVQRYAEGVAHLQYTPERDQITRALTNLPVELTGSPTDPRTRVRGGAVLVLVEGILQKAPKLRGHVRRLGLGGWEWLEGITPAKKKARGKRYLEDITAGRPVLSHPNSEGGFRLRYGRARNTGMATVGLHPATMELLGLSAGTQLKLEYPGKSGAVAPSDSIEGPTVRLNDGSTLKPSPEQLEELGRIAGIVELGDILVSFGDFLENNHPLVREGSFVGARMGRPEKAAPRLMNPPPHLLFPVGRAGGPMRNLAQATETEVELGSKGRPPTLQKIGVRTLLGRAAREVREAPPAILKGVKGLTSGSKIPEPIEKGILRAKHGCFVFRDGTIRFDATNLPLTHFKPSEVGVPVERLRGLGYERDREGDELRSEDQVLELGVQDVVLPRSAGEYMVKAAGFVDALLERFYGIPGHYRAGRPEDLVGRLVVGIAPHTSMGVVGRILGFAPSSACLAHPFFHAARRRDCDGDADSYALLLDVLLNFSRHFLPSSPGGSMDAPLLLLTRVNPEEVDRVAHNMEAASEYPAELHTAAAKGEPPARVPVERVGTRLERGERPEVGVTAGSASISAGPKRCRYRELERMEDKVAAQLELAERIRAVDEQDVAERLIEHHFIPDLVGNLRRFAGQQFRCTSCGSKYRRIPLVGSCPKCGGRLVLTVTEAGIKKYLATARRVAERYRASRYIQQRLELIEEEIGSVFGGRQLSLADFM